MQEVKLGVFLCPVLINFLLVLNLS